MNNCNEHEQSLSAPVNGFEFARTVLDQRPDDGVEMLLATAAMSGEVDWLEKKAAVYRSEKNEKDEKYCKSLAKLKGCPPETQERETAYLQLELLKEIAYAIVALHNSRGGVVLIGIDDKSNDAVSFADNDGDGVWHKRGAEAFVRESVLDRLCRERGEFCFKRETFVIPVKETRVFPKWCRYKGQDVLALLVPSLPTSNPPLLVTHTENNSSWNEVPKRGAGDQGRVEKGKPVDRWIGSASQMNDFHRDRQERYLDRADLSAKLRELGLSVVASDAPHSSLPQKPVFSSVNDPRAPRFVGRDKDLDELHRLLSDGKIPIVTGPGGTGKSELVLQYAAKHKADYPGGMFQIDMEQAKSWDDAFRKLLETPRVAMRDVLDLPPNGGEAGKEGRGSASAQEIAGALSRRAERFGRVLLVLDNVESVRTFLRGPALENLSLSPDVRLVATARTCDVDFRPTDRACSFALRDLPLEAALDLLLADNPAESDPERSAAASIAKMLDCRALFLKAVPALLDDPYSPCYKSYAALESALRDNLQETVDAATKDYGEEERTPSALWMLTKTSLGRHPMGAAWIKLAHIASFFSADGFRKCVLRQLWDALVVSDAGTDREFDQALVVLRRHGVLDGNADGTQFRMHRLTFATLRRVAREDDPEIEDKIGSTVANNPEADGGDWISLSDSLEILKHISKDSLDFESLFNLIVVQPGFVDVCKWNWCDKFHGDDMFLLLGSTSGLADKWNCEHMLPMDWHWILPLRPDLADKCPWEEISTPILVSLLGMVPFFDDKCRSERLSGSDWAELLGGDCWIHRARLEFADQCDWTKLDGSDWASLLVRQPQFDDRYDWGKLNGSDWVFLLLGGWNAHEIDPTDAAWAGEPRPDLLKQCPWERLSDEDLDLVFDDPPFPDWMEPPDYFKLVSDLAKEKDPNAMFVLERIKKLGYGEKTEA